MSIINDAINKIEEEIKKNIAQRYYVVVLEHIKSRVSESEALASDVMRPTKNIGKCFEHIRNEARKHAKGNVAMIEDSEVFEWAEDYYHMEDKEEPKKIEKKETKPPVVERAAKKIEKKEIVVDVTETKTKEEPKKKAATKSNDGQMDIFSMFGFGG